MGNENFINTKTILFFIPNQNVISFHRHCKLLFVKRRLGFSLVYWQMGKLSSPPLNQCISQEDILEAETAKHTYFATLFVSLEKVRNFIAAILYFLAAHLYDGLCYAVSNIVSYPVALFIMTVVLFSASVILVQLHDVMRKRFLWDVLGINKINNLAITDRIPKHKFFKRLLKWAMHRGHWWIHIIGSATIGPPVATLLLRKKGSWQSSLSYLTSGTLISVIIWVTIWAGVGKLTWNQYVRPCIQTLLNNWG
jgi:hypothetical protein